MRAVSNVFKMLIWAFMVIYIFIEGLVIYSLQIDNGKYISKGQIENVYNIFPLLLTTLLMFASVIIFMLLKKHRYIGLILAVIAAVAMFVIAMSLARKFPVHLGIDKDLGLSKAKLFWRHIGIAIIPLLMLPSWLMERAADKEDSMRAVMKNKSGYDLSGSMIFRNEEANEKSSKLQQHPLKRSMKKRQKKQ